MKLKIFSLLLVISFFSLQAQEETQEKSPKETQEKIAGKKHRKITFFKFNFDIASKISLNLNDLSEKFAADESIMVSENFSQMTHYWYDLPAADTYGYNLSVEYWRLNEDFDFSQPWPEYNFLIGVSLNSSGADIASSTFYPTRTIKNWIVPKSALEMDGFGIGSGTFELNNEDIYVGIPLYLKNNGGLVIPKILERKQELIFRDAILMFENGNYKIPVGEENVYADVSGSGILGSSEYRFYSLQARSKMIYKGLSLEKKLSERYDIVADYLVSDKSKGSHTLSDIRFGDGKIDYNVSQLKDTFLSGNSFEFTLGSYSVSGKKSVLGLKYNYKSNISFYLNTVRETFEISFPRIFTLYNSTYVLDDKESTTDRINSDEMLLDFLIWGGESEISIDEYRIGVTYKL